MAKSNKRILLSGNNLIWKDFPKTMLSKLPIDVNSKTNSIDPKYPPKIVCNCEPLKKGLNICIPENTSIQLINAKMNEVPVDTAKKKTRIIYIINLKNY